MLVMIVCPETEAEQDGVLLGQSSGELTRRTRRDIAEVADRLQGYRFDIVYVSDLQHAQDTWRSLRFRLGHVTDMVEMREELRERSLGTYEGRRLDDLHKELAPSRYREWERDYYATPPFGESLHDVATRLEPLVQQLREDFRARRDVLMIAHPDTLRVLVGCLRGDLETDVEKTRLQRNIPYWIHNTDRLIPSE